MDKPKIIIWDLETSLMETYIFHMQRKFKGYIPYRNITSNYNLICACWKELGSKKTNSVSLLDDKARFEKDPADDYYVVKTIADVIRDADILIAHNGDQFDVKTLNARLAYHQLPPLPKVLTVDTLKKARQIGQFPSNSLNDLADYFKLGEKIDTDFDLWVRCFKGEKKAIKEMTTYCKHDVVLNEKVYLRLRPYMKTHPNIAEPFTMNCTKCGSDHVHKHKVRLTASGIRKQQYQCQDCGTYFTQRKAESDKPLSA